MFHKMASPLFSADWELLCTEDTFRGGEYNKTKYIPLNKGYNGFNAFAGRVYCHY